MADHVDSLFLAFLRWFSWLTLLAVVCLRPILFFVTIPHSVPFMICLESWKWRRTWKYQFLINAMSLLFIFLPLLLYFFLAVRSFTATCNLFGYSDYWIWKVLFKAHQTCHYLKLNKGNNGKGWLWSLTFLNRNSLRA